MWTKIGSVKPGGDENNDTSAKKVELRSSEVTIA